MDALFLALLIGFFLLAGSVILLFFTMIAIVLIKAMGGGSSDFEYADINDVDIASTPSTRKTKN